LERRREIEDYAGVVIDDAAKQAICPVAVTGTRLETVP
jgi:hypothetical protein